MTKTQRQNDLVDAIFEVTSADKTGTFHWDGGFWMMRNVGGKNLNGLALTGDHGTPDVLIVPLSNDRCYCVLGIRIESIVEKTLHVPVSARVANLGGLDFVANLKDSAAKIVTTLALLNVGF